MPIGTLCCIVSTELRMAEASPGRPRCKTSRQQHRYERHKSRYRQADKYRGKQDADTYTSKTGRQTDRQTNRQTARRQAHHGSHSTTSLTGTHLSRGSMESAECKATHCSGLPSAQVGWIQVLRAIHAPPQQGGGHFVVQGRRFPIICLIYALPLLVPPMTICRAGALLGN